jgi:hypothetical protein
VIGSWHHVLKGKFLEGRQNRRLDHLLYILLCKVVEYYSLKGRRKSIRIEGPDLEVQKRKAILERSLKIPADDITQVDPTEPVYRIKSSSIPGQFYDIDILAYNCTCCDYPEINFCKHISAIQRYFPSSDDATSAGLDALALDVDSPSPLLPSSPSTDDLIYQPSIESSAASLLIEGMDDDTAVASLKEKEQDRLRIVEKLETLAACIRHNNLSENPNHTGSEELERLLDCELSFFHPRQLLPAAKRLSPHLNSWPETRAVMMPAKKGRKKRTGDAYGAGEQSGKKAKKDSFVGSSVSAAG